MPFVKFHVERILERNDTSSAEGRDRAFRELQPALRDLPKNAFGQELLRRVAGRLELSEARLATLIESSGRHDVALSAGAGSGSAGAGGRTNGGGGAGGRRGQVARASHSTRGCARSGRSSRCASPCRRRGRESCSRSISTG